MEVLDIDLGPVPQVKELNPPPRLMLGPGPSNAHPRVYQAMALPQVGHLDPFFLNMVEEIKDLLRYVWQTENVFTIPVSGTASAAWEACCANLLEPGDKTLAFVSGYFGYRHCDMASRYGAVVIKEEKPFGEIFTLQEIETAIEKHKPDLVWMVHGETSTGALQSVEGVGDICRKNNCLFLLDTVTTTGGIPVFLDKWKVDAAYAGGQKCLACPPGIAPLTFGPRAMEKLAKRKSKVANWYLDMNMIAQYMVPKGGPTAPRVYHHTAPISMIYALREALRVLVENGLKESWTRHRGNAEYLWKGLEDMGLQLHVDINHRLPSLTTVKVPEGVDPAKVNQYLLKNYNIEIGGGLGQLAGKVWRIGLMGYNSRRENCVLLLAALKNALADQGWPSQK